MQHTSLYFLLFTLFFSAPTAFAQANRQSLDSPALEQVSTPASVGDAKRISLNRASAEELATGLQGIGIKKAQNIVDYRQRYGDFTDIRQLQEVSGIGEKLYQLNQDRLTL